jgi:transglutaminase/protease-like cytokinesis protein 3
MPIPLIVIGVMAAATALGWGGSKYGEHTENEAEALRARTLGRLKTKEMELARKRKSLYDRLISYSDMIRSHLQSVQQSGSKANRKLPSDLQAMVDSMSAAVATAGSFAPQISKAQSAKNVTTLIRSY